MSFRDLVPFYLQVLLHIVAYNCTRQSYYNEGLNTFLRRRIVGDYTWLYLFVNKIVSTFKLYKLTAIGTYLEQWPLCAQYIDSLSTYMLI